MRPRSIGDCDLSGIGPPRRSSLRTLWMAASGPYRLLGDQGLNSLGPSGPGGPDGPGPVRLALQVVIAAIALLVAILLSAVLNSAIAGLLIAICLAAAASQILA